MDDYQEQVQQQPQQPQQPLGQPVQPAVEQAPVLSMMDWVVVFILMSLPIVNIIMLIIWTVSENVNPNKRNFAKAGLIMTAISIVFFVAFLGRMVGTILSLMEQLSLNM